MAAAKFERFPYYNTVYTLLIRDEPIDKNPIYWSNEQSFIDRYIGLFDIGYPRLLKYVLRENI